MCFMEKATEDLPHLPTRDFTRQMRGEIASAWADKKFYIILYEILCL